MAYDETLANRIRRQFEGRTDITERKMFGGLAFLCDGRMCCGIVGVDLMARVPAAEYETVRHEHGVRPMDFTGRPLTGFVYVSPEAVRGAASLKRWLACGERAAREHGRRPASRQRARAASRR